MDGRWRRFAPPVALVAMLTLAAPAMANHTEPIDPTETPAWMLPDGSNTALEQANPREGLEEVGFHALENKGFNTDIMPWVSMNGGVFAATGTWGSIPVLGAAPEGDACPSERDPTGQRNAGIRIIEATDSAQPELVAKLPTIPGAQNNDPKVLTMPTTGGPRDLLIHSLEPCGIEGILHQIPGSPIIDVATTVQQAARLDQTGFQIYDVSNPASPLRLGTWNNGGIGTHNLYPFVRGDRAYVAAVFNKVDFLGVEGPDLIVGILQIIDVTDPSNPSLVSQWRLPDAGLGCPARGVDSDHCFLHDVWTNDAGTIAYLAYWDAGLVLLDITEPATPRFLGQALNQVQGADPDGWLNEEGNTHSMVPLTLDGRHLVIVGDEDFTGGGQIGVGVNEPADLVGFQKAVQWAGSSAVDGQTGDFVYAGTGCTAADYAVAGGPAAVQGKIAFVDDREPAAPFAACPSYTFAQKVNAAAAAGAIGFVQLVREGREPNANATAVSATIPALELFRNDQTVAIRNAVVASSPAATPGGSAPAVNATLGRGGDVDPWGFMRVVDVGAAGEVADPSTWREVSVFKAPHVEDPTPGSDDVFSAHNPIIGPDGRVYWSWYTNGARVLELSDAGRSVNEMAWFAPLPSDHEGDNDSDPNLAQEDNVGFWGTWPLCHPETGDLLVFNSDLNRGIYILRAQYDDCREDPDLTIGAADITAARGQDGVRISARVHNVGAADAQAVQVAFEFAGRQLGDAQVIASIPAGGTGAASAVVPFRRFGSGGDVGVVVDPRNTITESDESNNSATRTLTVRDVG